MENNLISSEKKPKSNTKKKILVNIITGLRALGTIAVVPIYHAYGALTTACTVAMFFLTDMIDGQLARRLHVQSFFGSLLDGLSDKAFGIVCLFLLALENHIFFIPIILEATILAVNINSMQRGNNVQSSIAGKLKTGILAASIVGGFLCLDAPGLKEILNYIHINSFDTLLNTKPSVLSKIAALPLIASEIIVIGDYVSKAKKQDQDKISQLENEIADINVRREALLAEKENLKIKNRELKSKDELLHDLFDTEFYLANKDNGIKKLLFKKEEKKEV